MIQCLLRIRDRENHETLTGNLAHKLSIVLMNYNFYNNFSFDGIQSLDYGIVIPFTDENYSEIDENLENLIKHILLSINTQTNPNISIYQDLAAYILHFSYDFLHVDASDQLEAQLLYIINNN